MRGIGIYCLIGLLVAGGAACGGGKTDEAKQAAKAAEQATKDADDGRRRRREDDVAKGMQQFAKAMEQMQKSPDGKAYEPVELQGAPGLPPRRLRLGEGRSRRARA